MTTYTNVPKLLFDPDIYMALLDEILYQSDTKYIDIYTIVFLNSVYMNEMLDTDVEWRDRSDEEYRTYVEERVRAFIEVGTELVRVNAALSIQEYTPEHTSARGMGPTIHRSTEKQVQTANNELRSVASESRLLEPAKKNAQQELIHTDKDMNSTLFDLMDNVPVDENDEFYKRVSKLKVSDSDIPSKVRFC